MLEEGRELEEDVDVVKLGERPHSLLRHAPAVGRYLAALDRLPTNSVHYLIISAYIPRHIDLLKVCSSAR
jgi:hypothetical protein